MSDTIEEWEQQQKEYAERSAGIEADIATITAFYKMTMCYTD